MKQKHPLKKSGVLLLAIMLLVCSMVGTAFADNPPTSGSITIHLTTELGTSNAGVEFRIYKVRRWNAATENWLPVTGQSDTIVLRAGMSGSDWADAARTLAQQTGLKTAATGKTDSSGTLTFPNLPLGMYLVVQEGANNYGVVAPFLAALPYISTDGDYTYDYAPAYNPKAAAFSASTPGSSGHDHIRRTPATSAEAISPLPPAEEETLPSAASTTEPDNAAPQQPAAPTTSDPLPTDPQPADPSLPDEPTQPADGDTAQPDQQPQDSDAPQSKNGWILPTAAGVAAAAVAGGFVFFRKRAGKTH